MTQHETLFAAERALNDFVSSMVRIYSMQVRSVFEPFPMTASEQWMCEQLRTQLQAAKAAHDAHQLRKLKP